jgi:hypothetical protein
MLRERQLVDEAKEKALEKPKDIYIGWRSDITLRANESIGKQTPIFIKKEQINNWRKTIDDDENIRRRETIIPRITSEHFKLLKKLNNKEEQPLKKLNEEL